MNDAQIDHESTARWHEAELAARGAHAGVVEHHRQAAAAADSWIHMALRLRWWRVTEAMAAHTCGVMLPGASTRSGFAVSLMVAPPRILAGELLQGGVR